MKKYTLAQIKKLPVYKHNIKAIRALYPDHVKDYARELRRAFSSSLTIMVSQKDKDLYYVFSWRSSPQGHDAWATLHRQIYRYNELTGASK